MLINFFYIYKKKKNPTTRLRHAETGTPLVVLPPPKLYRWIRHCIPQRPKLMGWRFDTTLRQGFRHSAYRAIRFLLRYLSTPLRALFAELRRDRCQSLIVQEYESARFDLCVLAGWWKKISVFGTYQGGLPQHAIMRPLRSLAMRHCAGLLIPARNEVQRAMKDYGIPNEKLFLTYTPVDTSAFFPLSRNEQRSLLGIPHDAKVAIYHGQILIDYKGLDVLLQAWKHLCEESPDPTRKLLVIGTGQDANAFARMLRGIPQVEWKNEWVQDRREIQRYLCSSDLYVCPSRGDAFPLAVIEAMACGLPVLASDVNGMMDIFEREENFGGVLVEPGKVAPLSDNLARLLNDPALRLRLGRQAYGRVISAFSMERIGWQLCTAVIRESPLRSSLAQAG